MTTLVLLVVQVHKPGSVQSGGDTRVTRVSHKRLLRSQSLRNEHRCHTGSASAGGTSLSLVWQQLEVCSVHLSVMEVRL